jgi:CRISPR/Cas system-associated protein Cas7 (RAMP superfamily)
MEKFAAQLQQVIRKKLIRRLSQETGIPYRNLYERIHGTGLWQGEQELVATVLDRWQKEGKI